MLFNVDGDLEGDRENGKRDRIAGKGQRSVLKGEPLGKEELDLFVSSIFILGSAFPTNTKNKKQFLPLAQISNDGFLCEAQRYHIMIIPLGNSN